jgi:hypothetical protein
MLQLWEALLKMFHGHDSAYNAHTLKEFTICLCDCIRDGSGLEPWVFPIGIFHYIDNAGPAIVTSGRKEIRVLVPMTHIIEQMLVVNKSW